MTNAQQTTPQTSTNSLAESRQFSDRELEPTTDFITYMKAYAREKPDVAALWCFGIGFVLGWKIKPW